jgi:choline kinase
MRIIILAAGIGHRLGDDADGKPKCLLEIDGISLLRRHFQILEGSLAKEVVIVTGYLPDEIENEIQKSDSSLNIRTVFNPDYTEGSIVSLHCARDILNSGDDVLLMDADVLYDCAIMHQLINTVSDNCFMMDKDFIPGDEPVKLCVKGNQLVEFRKQIAPDLDFDFCGESVGFFKFSPPMTDTLAQKVQEYVETDRRNLPHEEAIRDILLEQPGAFDFEDITGLAWIEIDFPEDVARARQEIITKIHNGNSRKKDN